MSFFNTVPPAALIEALMTHDVDTATMLLGDSQGELEDFLATQTFVNLTGTLDGAGAGTVAHGIDLTGSTILLAQAWYAGGSGQHKPLVITYIDATNIVVTGGSAGAAAHATLVVGVGFITF